MLLHMAVSEVYTSSSKYNVDMWSFIVLIWSKHVMSAHDMFSLTANEQDADSTVCPVMIIVTT